MPEYSIPFLATLCFKFYVYFIFLEYQHIVANIDGTKAGCTVLTLDMETKQLLAKAPFFKGPKQHDKKLKPSYQKWAYLPDSKLLVNQETGNVAELLSDGVYAKNPISLNDAAKMWNFENGLIENLTNSYVMDIDSGEQGSKIVANPVNYGRTQLWSFMDEKELQSKFNDVTIRACFFDCR